MRADLAEEELAEPTLGELLTRFARTTIPTRLYQLLHLAFPLAVDCAFHGWWRAAAWATAVTAFGAWGLADRWLWNAAEYGYETDEQPRGWRVPLARAIRITAGATAATITTLLALELFLHLLGAAPIS